MKYQEYLSLTILENFFIMQFKKSLIEFSFLNKYKNIL